MSKFIHLAGKIPAEWGQDIQAIQAATGQTQSEILREAIALYLKKAKVPVVKSRLNALEERLNKLAVLNVQMLPDLNIH